MGYRRLAILLVVICGLLALLYSTETGSPESEGLGKSLLENRRLLAADRIIIQPSSGRSSLELFRADDGYFYLEDPVKDLASSARLTSIAGSYDSARIFLVYDEAQITAKIREETGLANPKGFLEARYADGKIMRFEIGLPGAMGDDLYIGKEGKIYFGELSLQTVLEGNPADYRERLLIRNRPSQIRQLKISREGKSGRETLVLRKQGDLWKLTEPAQLRLDQSVARGLVASILGMRADSFIPGVLNPDAGPPREVDVIVELEGDAGRERLEFSVNPQGGMVGNSLNRNILFSCDSGTYANVFNIPIQQIRARWLLPFAISDMDWIKIDPGIENGPVMELGRRGSKGYKLRQPVKADTNATTVSKLLQVFREFFVQSFVEDGSDNLNQYGLEEGFLSVQLHDSRMGRTLTLHIGDDQDQDLTYLRRADEPHVVTVPKVLADRLRWHWTEYIGLVALEIKNHLQIDRVECTVGDSTAVYVRERGEWHHEGVESAGDFDRFAELFDDVLRELAGTKAFDPAAVDALPEPLEMRLMRAGGQVLHSLTAYDFGDERMLVRRGGTRALIELTHRDARDLIGLWPKR